MSQASTVKMYRTFVKGLITEASPLAYPENSSTDEDNCVLTRKGNRSRRLGIGYEENFRMSLFEAPMDEISQYAFKEYRWESVSNKANINFLVQQVGTILYFYDLSTDTISDHQKSFVVDMDQYVVPGTTFPGSNEVFFAAGYGYLFVAGERFEPFVCEYSEEDDTIVSEPVVIKIRDFDGVDDGLGYDEEPTTLSNLHRYNLMNQGWVSPRNRGAGAQSYYFSPKGKKLNYPAPDGEPIEYFKKILGRYPGNNKQWWVGKAPIEGNNYFQGEFNPAYLERFFAGNTPAPRGHFILEAFKQDRSGVSGVPGLVQDFKDTRPACVGFFAGRAWWGHESRVFFSQILDSRDKAGSCYQEADPTSETLSDLVASDGGVVSIPEMAKAVALVPLGSSMVVFATNGVWLVTGNQNGFTAIDVTVMKVNPLGTDSPNSVVDAGGQLFWFSKVGILGMSAKLGLFGPVEGSFEKINLTESTIQEFYNDIPEASRQYVKAVYDPSINTIQWLFKTADVAGNCLYNKILNLDLTLQAFYPWSVSGVEGESPFIVGAIITPRINLTDVDIEVISDGVEVVDGSNSVVFADYDIVVKNTFIKYPIIVPENGKYKLTYGFFNDESFSDWREFDGDGLPYLSYVETGYEILEDLLRQKQAPVISTFFTRTEQSFLPTDDGFTVDFPSSCYFQTKWDWASHSSANKWSTKTQAYRHRRLPFFSEDDLTFNSGYDIVVSRHKVRGRGRAIQFRFECDEIGKNFDLLGWSVAFTGNSRP